MQIYYPLTAGLSEPCSRRVTAKRNRAPRTGASTGQPSLLATQSERPSGLSPNWQARRQFRSHAEPKRIPISPRLSHIHAAMTKKQVS